MKYDLDSPKSLINLFIDKAPTEQIRGQWKLYIPQLIFPINCNIFDENSLFIHLFLGIYIINIENISIEFKGLGKIYTINDTNIAQNA